MTQFFTVSIMVLIVFGVCFAAMAVGLIFRGVKMRGGCGHEPELEDDRLPGCGVCPKKEVDLCESDDTTGLAAISTLQTLGRFDDDPARPSQEASSRSTAKR